MRVGGPTYNRSLAMVLNSTNDACGSEAGIGRAFSALLGGHLYGRGRRAAHFCCPLVSDVLSSLAKLRDDLQVLLRRVRYLFRFTFGHRLGVNQIRTHAERERSGL
jgi:hypothetical protein